MHILHIQLTHWGGRGDTLENCFIAGSQGLGRSPRDLHLYEPSSSVEQSLLSFRLPRGSRDFLRLCVKFRPCYAYRRAWNEPAGSIRANTHTHIHMYRNETNISSMNYFMTYGEIRASCVNKIPRRFLSFYVTPWCARFRNRVENTGVSVKCAYVTSLLLQ